MSYVDIINFILIVVIVAFVLNIVIRKLTKQSIQKQLNLQDNTNNINNPIQINLATDKDRLDYLDSSDDLDSMIYSSEISSASKSNSTCKNIRSDMLIPSDKQTDQFVDEYVYNGRNKLQSCKMSDSQMDDFKDNYFEFRDRVWNSSHGQDVVDEMNQQYLLENENNVNVNPDMKIKDIYDSLTSNKINNPKIDTITRETFYTKNGSNGQFAVNDIHLYDNENIMNGGQYYDQVYGNDQLNEQPLFLE